jgi:hypothetical protein
MPAAEFSVSIYLHSELAESHENSAGNGPSLTFLDKLILEAFPQVSGSVAGPGAYDLTARRPAASDCDR